MLDQLAMRAARGTKMRVHRHLIDRGYDRAGQVDTAGLVAETDLVFPGENAGHGNEYEPSPTRVFRRALGALRIEPSRFVFVDLGSGKGRAVLLAAEYPFRRVDGVELSTELHRIAERNVSRAPAGGPPIVLHNVDAASYRLPPGPFVVYIYNSFREPVMRQVAGMLEASLRREPREGYVIYLNPKHRAVFDRSVAFEPVARSGPERVLDWLISPTPLALYRTPDSRG